MKRVIVIGSPGAGKSTFARALRDRTGLPLYYLDAIWHLPDRTTVSTEEFDRRLAAILALDEWIVDGNFSRTMETRIRACDTVFLLDYPLEVCLAGAAARVGIAREEMPWVEETFDPAFRRHIIGFQTMRLPQARRLVERYAAGCEVHIFRSREEAAAFLDGLTGR